MKKVIVKMANDSLSLNFHPKLSALVRTEPLHLRVCLGLQVEG